MANWSKADALMSVRGDYLMFKIAHSRSNAAFGMLVAKAGIAFRHVGFRKDETIFARGGEADCLFYIEQGAVKKVHTSSDGKEGIVAVLKRGDFLGQGCLMGSALRRTDAIAMTDCSLMRIERPAMMDALSQDLSVADFLISFLIDQHHRSEETLKEHLFCSSQERLAKTLLRLSAVSEGATLPKVSQETLAQMVGTTRARINQFMNKFRREGLVAFEGDRILISSQLRRMVAN